MNYPVYYKGYSDNYFVKVISESKSVTVQLFTSCLEVGLHTGNPPIVKCGPCTEEEFFLAAAKVMELLNAALLPNLSTPAQP